MINLALLGYGKVAQDQHLKAIKLNSNINLVAVLDKSKKKVKLPFFSSIKKLKNSNLLIDAVSICTPPKNKFKIALDAIDQGCNILLEKPPAISIAQCRKIITKSKIKKKSVFFAWHSKYAKKIPLAKKWLAQNKCSKISILWKENFSKWHCGQDWIYKKDGFGVFDAGINALSILTEFFESDFHPTDVIFFKPLHWSSPVAAKFILTNKAKIKVDAFFDWRVQKNVKDIREITFLSEKNETMKLLDGGNKIKINKKVIKKAIRYTSEYTNLYLEFCKLINQKKSNLDYRPLKIVLELFKKAKWVNINKHVL